MHTVVYFYWEFQSSDYSAVKLTLQLFQSIRLKLNWDTFSISNFICHKKKKKKQLYKITINHKNITLKSNTEVYNQKWHKGICAGHSYPNYSDLYALDVDSWMIGENTETEANMINAIIILQEIQTKTALNLPLECMNWGSRSESIISTNEKLHVMFIS